MANINYPVKRFEAMPPSSHGSRILWRWGNTSNNRGVPMPVMAYYFSMPEDARCVFSLNDQITKPRLFDRLGCPDRKPVAWDNDRIEKEAQSLRDKYPDEALKVFRPNTWEDLYLYFDPHDLWLQGAWNLWCVIDLLGEQNTEPAFFAQARLKNRPRCDRRHERFAIVDDWVWRWLTTEQNREKISTWNHQTDILYQLWAEDWMSIGKDGLLPDELERLRDQLLFWHHQYYCVSKVQLPRRSQSCSDQMVTINDVHQWMGCCFDEETYNLRGSADTAAVAGPEARAISVTPSGILPKPDSDIAPRPSSSAGVSSRQLVYPAVMNGTIEGTAYQTTVIRSSELETLKETRQPKTHHKGSKSGPVIPVPVNTDLANRGAGVEKSGPSRLPSRSMQPPAEEKTTVNPQPLDISNHAIDLETTARATSHQSKPSQESVTSGKSIVSQDVSLKSPDSIKSPVHNNNNITHVPAHGLLAHSRLMSAESRRQRTWEACKNARKDGRAYGKHCRQRSYVECGCQRCARASRSVWVSNFMPNLDKKRTTQLLNKFFSQWGNVEYCELKNAEKGYPYAIVQYTSEVSAQQALHAAQGAAVLYVSNALQTKYPFYSKYYKELPRPGFVARVSPLRAPPGINFNGATGQNVHQHHARMSTSPPFAGHSKPLEHSAVPASSVHCYHVTTNAAYRTPPKQSPPGAYSPINGRGPLTVSPPFPKFRPQQAGLYLSSLPANYDADIDGRSPPRGFTWQLSLEHSSSTRPTQGFANGSPPSMMGPSSMPAYVQGALNSGPTQALTPQAAPWFPPGRQSVGANIPVPKPVQSVQTKEPLEQSSPVNKRSPDSMNSSIDCIRVRLPSMSPEMQFASTGIETGSPKVSGEPATPEKQNSSSLDPAIVTDGEAAPGSLFALPPTSRFGQGDIRLELDFSATVIHRKNKFDRRIPALWTSGAEVEEGQAIQKKASSKKKKNKQGKGSVSRPSTPTNHEQEAQATGEDNANSHVPVDNKGYRADAGGSLRMPRKRPCPALNTLYSQESVPIAGASNHAMVPTGSQGEVDKPTPVAEEASKKKEYDPHGSFRNLPKGFDPFPRAAIESIKSLPPIVLTAPSEPKPQSNAPPVVEEHLNAGHRPSTSPTKAHFPRTSYLDAQRRSSSCNGSPKSDDDQLFVSAPQTPLVDEHGASSATLSVNVPPIPGGITAIHDSLTQVVPESSKNHGDIPEPPPVCKNKGKEPIRDDSPKNVDSAVAPKPAMVVRTIDKDKGNRTLSNRAEKKKPASAHDSRSLSKFEEKKSKSSNSNTQEGNFQPSNKAEGKKTHVSNKADEKTRSRSSTPTEFGRKIERRNGQHSNKTGERSRPSTPTQFSDKTDGKAKSVTATQFITEAKVKGKASVSAQPSTKAEAKKPESSTGAPSADKDDRKKSQSLKTAETRLTNDAESNERSSSGSKREDKSKPSASTPTQGAGDSREKHRPSAPSPLAVQGEKKLMPSTSDQPAAKAEQKPIGFFVPISPQTSPRKKNKKLNKRLNLAKRKRTEASAATVPGAASL